MKIKTKFRIDLLTSTILAVGILTVAPFFGLSKLIQENDQSYFKEPSILLLFIFSGLLWVGILAYLYHSIITKTLVVTINGNEKSIIFTYPFKLQKQKYFFDEIIGFRFSSIYTRICDFKTLIIKTKNNKQYILSELQTTNFYTFENFFIQNFNLTKGVGFEILLEKEEELKKNIEFEMEQAKSYRLTCYIHLVLIFLALVINKYIAIPDRKFGWMSYGLCFGLFIYLLIKIVKANRTIKNYS